MRRVLLAGSAPAFLYQGIEVLIRTRRTMSRPLTVTIPHNLGREAALKRIKDGVGQLRSTYAGQFTVLDETWKGDTLDFRISALKQTVSGSIEVAETAVTVSVILPIFLSMLAEKAKAVIQKRGQLMLEKK
jgi:putative polyhydroxyalkanoate system protein